MDHVWTVFAFLHHLPLVVIVAVVIFLVAGRLGRPFGVHLLVWHERSWPRFAAGVSLTLLVSQVGLIGLILDRDVVSRLASNRIVPGSHVLTILAAAGMVTVVAMALARRNPLEGTSPIHRVSFPAGVAIGMALFMSVLEARNSRFFAWAAENFAPVHDWFAARLGSAMPSSPELHGLAAVLTAILVLLFGFGFRDWHARRVTPVVSVCTLLGLLASIFGFVAFWIDSRLPVAVIVLLALRGVMQLAGAQRHKVGYEELAGAPVPLSENGGVALPALPHMSTPITAREANGQPLVVVCVSGGASRAGAWTAAVLARLEGEIAGFSSRTTLITGASGGMVGAAYHVAGLRAPDEHFVVRCWPDEARDAIQRLGADNLSQVVHRLVHADLLSTILPWAPFKDRGRALEEAWKETLEKRLEPTLEDMREGEEQGWRPSLVFSPMLIEDGRRLLVSNLDLEAVASNEVRALGMPGGTVRSQSEVELRKLFPTKGGALKLCTAARMSASFPFVSPAAVLPTTPRRRVVDAGYYDNYGVNLAAIWLDANREALQAHDGRVVIVQIRDGPSEVAQSKIDCPDDEGTWLSRGLEWLTSPVLGVLAARNSSMSYRNDEALEFLQRSLPNVMTVVFEAPEGVSMTWYLSQDEQRTLTVGLTSKAMNARVQALKDWWPVAASVAG